MHDLSPTQMPSCVPASKRTRACWLSLKFIQKCIQTETVRAHEFPYSVTSSLSSASRVGHNQGAIEFALRVKIESCGIVEEMSALYSVTITV